MKIYKKHKKINDEIKEYKKFLYIYVFICPIIIIPIVLSTDFIIYNKDDLALRMLNTMNSRKVDVLYFGDSSIESFGPCDKPGNISLFFEQKINKRVITIAKPGYSPIIFKEYVKLLPKIKNKPKLIIFPINMRMFSDAWIKRPDFHFKLKQLYIHYLYSDKIDLIEYFQYRFLKKQEKDMALWRGKNVLYGDIHLGTVKEVLENSNISSKPPLECMKEEYDHLYEKQLTLQFNFNYMNVVSFDNPMFSHIKEMIKEANDMDIKIFTYLNPINFKDGIKYVGQDFTNRFLENTQIVKEFLKNNRIDYLDLSAYMGANYFVDKYYTSEHVDIVGKRLVAEGLAKEIIRKELLN